MKPPVIRIRDLRHAYGQGESRMEVLRGISGEFASGEITLLMGPSGAGKTTLLKLIAGLRTIQHGEVEIAGVDVVRASQKALVALRRRIGFIFQSHHLIASLNLEQNVMMPLSFMPGENGRSARKKARAMLEHVGLAGHEFKRPSELSGGMKQRAAVARALIHEPELILADEPTASLDGATGQSVVSLLAQLAREQGTSIIMVTHDPRITDIADTIYHIEDGEMSPQPSEAERGMLAEYQTPVPFGRD
ncbi:MAG: ABC transporter ATP-binding protein [Opitutales bacterium]